jgi:hypothetical protein
LVWLGGQQAANSLRPKLETAIKGLTGPHPHPGSKLPKHSGQS